MTCWADLATNTKLKQSQCQWTLFALGQATLFINFTNFPKPLDSLQRDTPWSCNHTVPLKMTGLMKSFTISLSVGSLKMAASSFGSLWNHLRHTLPDCHWLEYAKDHLRQAPRHSVDYLYPATSWASSWLCWWPGIISTNPNHLQNKTDSINRVASFTSVMKKMHSTMAAFGRYITFYFDR